MENELKDGKCNDKVVKNTIAHAICGTVLKTLRGILKYVGIGILGIAFLVYLLWCVGALCYAPFPTWFPIFAGVLMVAFPIAMIFLRRYWKLLFLAEFAVLIMISIVFSRIQPSNDRDWTPEYRRMPRITWSDNGLSFTVTDMRDFLFRTPYDYDEKFCNKTYWLPDFKGLYYVLVDFENPLGEMIGHSMLGFRFRDDFFFVSCETRRDGASEYGAVRDLYKQDGMILVFGTASDLIGVRTNARTPREQVRMYKTIATAKDAEILLRRLTARLDQLHSQPEFYNTLKNNCFLGIKPVVETVATKLPPWSVAYLLNGYSVELLYDLDYLEKKSPEETLEEVRARSFINPRTESWNYVREDFIPLMIKEK